MGRRSVADWLRWQESLNPRGIDLGLDRVREVLGRLQIAPPPGAVYTVAGTNGKGSTAGLLRDFLLAAGRVPGLYTSPHLVRYNERIQVRRSEVADDSLLHAFERVEAARGEVPLTYFEFGTLAALVAFDAAGCDAWVLEVGLGGRLDAVNAVDADYALITTIALDHQEWLGDTLDAIAAEKAGILRAGRHAFYGDSPVPGPILQRARELGAPLVRLGHEYRIAAVEEGNWAWEGPGGRLAPLRAVRGWAEAQYRNAGLALAALRVAGIPSAGDPRTVDGILPGATPPGRFERLHREPHEWVLDVAHNPQAAGVLRRQLDALPAAPTTFVISLLADKSLPGFMSELAPLAACFIACGVDDPRSRDAVRMAEAMAATGIRTEAAADVESALVRATELTPAGGRIVVCGSFRVTGPAREWLGLY